MKAFYDKRRLFGKQAEHKALSHIEAIGFVLIQCNYRTRFGEIDIIARDASTLVFIEVRARCTGALVSAPVSVDWHKRQKFKRTVRLFLNQEKIAQAAKSWAREIRFDLIALDDQSQLIHIRNAFT